MKKKKIKKQESYEINAWQDFIFSKKEILTAAVIVFSILVIYLSFPCKQFFFDGLMYASIVEAKEVGWKDRLGWANHLSYNYYGHAAWLLLKRIGIEKDGYAALQVMNSFFGAFTVGIFFLFLRRLVSKMWIAVVFSCTLAFSYAFWYRAVDAQVYPPSVFWLLISFVLTWSYTRQKSGLKIVILAVTAGLAVLAHQGNIFFIPMVLWGICIPHGKKLKNILIFGIISGIVIAVPYIHVLTYQEKTLIDKSTGRFAINDSTIKASFMWLRGNAGDYTPDDGEYVNAYWQPKLKHIITDFKTMVWAVWFARGNYYNYGNPSKPGQIWMFISKIIFVILGAALFLKTKIYVKYKTLFTLTLVWWISYMLFVSWFNPGNPDYWYQHWIPIFALYACSLYEFLQSENISLLLKKTALGLFLCSAVIMPTVNFFDSIYPISIVENNKDYSRALWVKKHVKENSIIIISGMVWNAGKVYIPSFANIGRISFDLIFVYNPKLKGLQILKDQIEMILSRGTNLYVLDEIFSKQAEKGLLEYKVTTEEIKEVFKPYDFKTLSVYNDGMKIMQVLPGKNSAAYQRNRGIKYYNIKDYKKAVEAFLKIPESSKTSFDYKLIGNCFMLQKDKINAMQNWKRGYAMNPNDNNLKEIIQYYEQQK
ncbi:MAG: DUF2723 domain-containing protein [Elusimicrobia bacterium]|nr:DUF2723 domain-containing protein [Elusimicrobiota bacterium]